MLRKTILFIIGLLALATWFPMTTKAAQKVTDEEMLKILYNCRSSYSNELTLAINRLNTSNITAADKQIIRDAGLGIIVDKPVINVSSHNRYGNSVSLQNLEINKTLLLDYCFVGWGGGSALHSKKIGRTRTIDVVENGVKKSRTDYQFYAVDARGRWISNRAWSGGTGEQDSKNVINVTWKSKPWVRNSATYRGISTQVGSPSRPDTGTNIILPFSSGNSLAPISDAKYAVDNGYISNMCGTLKINTSTRKSQEEIDDCLRKITAPGQYGVGGTFYQNNKDLKKPFIKGNSDITVLKDYAYMLSGAEDYTPGQFVMYYYYDSSQTSIWNGGAEHWKYQLFTTKPGKCPAFVCGSVNAKVQFQQKPTSVTTKDISTGRDKKYSLPNEDFAFKFKVKNESAKHKIRTKDNRCEANPPAGYLGCLDNNSYYDATIKIFDNNGGANQGKVVKRLFYGFTLDEGKEAPQTSAIIKREELEGSNFKVEVHIPQYKEPGANGLKESSYADNKDTIFIEFPQEDASIGSTTKDKFDQETGSNIRLKVTNKMSKTIGTGDASESALQPNPNAGAEDGKKFTLVVKKRETGEIVHSESKDFTLESGKSKTIVSKPNLGPGKYRATATIPWYQLENSSIKWDNNQVTFDFEIEMNCLPKPMPPENLECKGMTLPYLKNTTEGFPVGPTENNENEDKVIKMCIGMYPNHPSTATEGGEGAFFVVNYRFFPMPLPPYRFSTIDQGDGKKGYCQIYDSNEVNNGLGEDDIGEIDSYIYYPADQKIGEVVKKLPEPYLVGPHSFRHYKYRGRMMTRDVDFNFAIKGPNKTVEAEGTIAYHVPNKCYLRGDEGVIDFVDVRDFNDEAEVKKFGHCREVYFYLPKAGDFVPPGDLEEMGEIPSNEERIHFKNPGLYTFELDAQERQEYRYQEDLGGEYQGRVKESGLTNKGLPRVDITKSVTNNAQGGSEIGVKYEDQELSEITISAKRGDKPVETTKDQGATPDDEYQNRCYVEEDGFDRTAFDGKELDLNGKPVGFGAPGDLNAKFHPDKKHICFHDHSIDYHYWLFDWSAPKWYSGEPEVEDDPIND